ncbi:MAG: cation:dicarboxylase symporter family transporter [Sphaerochaetaceae bacterium]|nr:cation:dicarboxylase symporter family transporter [Sphaerochaetaceae bacterium]
MKTWLTYLAASAMGLAFELVFKDNALFCSVMTFMADIVMRLGIFIVFPLAFFTMTAGTASLTRKKGENGFVWLSSIFWALFTSVVLAVAGALIFRSYPSAFPTSSTLPKTAEDAAVLYQDLASATFHRLGDANPLSVNAFVNLIKSTDCLLPIIFVAIVFGYAIRPTSEIVRPAYITMNSISEVMFRLAKNIAKLLWVGVFFISGTWYEKLWTDGSVFESWKFILLCVIAFFGCLLVVIPLVYAIATGFRRNPYRQICRLLSAATAAFFSVNFMFSQPALYTDCRINLGIQKKVVSTALPIHSIITKGGSALISTICTCSIVFAVNGSMPTSVQVMTIALACTLASFICSLHAGFEVVFASSFALTLLNIDISGAEFAIIGILPLLNGLALMFDTLLAGLGTSFTAYQLKADCYIREKDTV